MDKVREDVFEQLFQKGAIRAVSLEMHDAHARIVYVAGDGSIGSIHTKRGQVKEYRTDTALRFLRGLGLANVTVDMSKWQLDQQQLPL